MKKIFIGIFISVYLLLISAVVGAQGPGFVAALIWAGLMAVLAIVFASASLPVWATTVLYFLIVAWLMVGVPAGAPYTQGPLEGAILVVANTGLLVGLHYAIGRRHIGTHRARTAKPGGYPGPEAQRLSLLEYLKKEAPTALADADAEILMAGALDYLAPRTAATEIILMDVVEDQARIVRAQGRAEAYAGRSLSLGEPVRARLAAERGIAFPDLKALSFTEMRGEFPAVLAPLGIRSLIMATVGPFGVLALGALKPRGFYSDDPALVISAGAQLAHIIETQKRLKKAEADLAKSLRLIGFTENLVAGKEPRRTIEAALTWAMEALGAISGSILKVDPKTGVLRLIAAAGSEEPERRVVRNKGEGIAGWVAKTGQPIVVEPMTDTGVTSFAGLSHSIHFPVVSRDKVVAVVNLTFPLGSPKVEPAALDLARQAIEWVLTLAEPYGDLDELWSLHIATIGVLADMREYRDRWRSGHSRRVKELARAVGQKLNLNEEELRALDVAAFLHTFGYLTVDQTLLAQRRRLNAREIAEIRSHAAIAADLLSAAPDMTLVTPIIRYHHERYDGRGYNGLTGEQIPIGARVLAAADAYQSMTSPRPYRAPLTKNQAIGELEDGAGAQFDPGVVRAALDVLKM